MPLNNSYILERIPLNYSLLNHFLLKNFKGQMLLIILCVFGFKTINAQSNALYSLTIPSISKNIISTSSWTNKKILILVADVYAPNLGQLSALEALYQNKRSNLVVVVVPGTDLTASLNPPVITKELIDSLGIDYIVTDALKVKIGATNQSPFIKWLTDKQSNGHFDTAIDKAGELFIVNESGQLFVRLKDAIPLNGKMIQNILNQ